MVKRYTTKTDIIRYYSLPNSSGLKLCKQNKIRVSERGVNVKTLVCDASSNPICAIMFTFDKESQERHEPP